MQSVAQSIHLYVVVQYDSHFVDPAHSDAFKAEIFFVWLARSAFLVRPPSSLLNLVTDVHRALSFLCLLDTGNRSIAAWCLCRGGCSILRDHLGDNVRKVIAIPIVYGVTSMVR